MAAVPSEEEVEASAGEGEEGWGRRNRMVTSGGWWSFGGVGGGAME